MPIYRIVLLLGCLLAANLFVFSQAVSNERKAQEIADDGVPVLVKHLPDWESAHKNSTFITNLAELKQAMGERSALENVDFQPGTEAVAANYPAGKVLLIEYSNPQASDDTDQKVLQKLAEAPDATLVYKRIGNYNAFVFDVTDAAAANTLLDGVQYEKSVQWLGEDPFLLKKLERYFVATTRDIFISTVLWILSGLGLATCLGIIVGLIYYNVGESKRKHRTAYSDAGGLTRLNLDGLSE